MRKIYAQKGLNRRLAGGRFSLPISLDSPVDIPESFSTVAAGARAVPESGKPLAGGRCGP
jgi:hypothetical protein